LTCHRALRTTPQICRRLQPLSNTHSLKTGPLSRRRFSSVCYYDTILISPTVICECPCFPAQRSWRPSRGRLAV
jgi:hypothetical protein